MSERIPMLVTGGLGFIGAAFIRRCVGGGTKVMNVDLDTYAGDERRLRSVADSVRTVRVDVAGGGVNEVIERTRPRVIVHFAAETHVTRSESDPERFWRTNVEGTRAVLDAGARVGADLILHISTDEVYGPCYGEPYLEDQKLPGEGRATSPYARSKALADDLARAHASTAPVIVARPTNCFGPWQHPEKAIPRWITKALDGHRLPVWGDGRQVRDWMFVEDACLAIELLIQRGESGEVYNIGPQG
ncbi:MAG: NAD-dependent epimerase/dehydratase family protein, partial [Actinobacteria bacterium]|nr:NAD-dependent epimerase/dehydratase family protein [Actinomycetota bacterium]